MAFYLVNAGGIESAEELSAGKLKRFRDRALTIRVFNVGKGEAILLSKKKEGVLFDGGAIVKKRNEPLGRALKEYVAQKEISLVSIVATHPHTDHLNALSTLLEADDPSFLAEDAVYYDNGVTMGKWLTETLGGRLNTLTSSGRLTVEPVTSGTHGFGPKDVEMYHFVDGPSKPKPIYKSIFTTVRYGDASFLFTGDAYESYEKDLLESPIAGQLSADVLKVTHHGSEHGTSERFVDRVEPKIAVASTADDPGHRLEVEVRNRLEGAMVYDTYTESGDIIVRTEGKEENNGGKSGVVYEIQIEKPGRFDASSW